VENFYRTEWLQLECHVVRGTSEGVAHHNSMGQFPVSQSAVSAGRSFRLVRNYINPLIVHLNFLRVLTFIAAGRTRQGKVLPPLSASVPGLG